MYYELNQVYSFEGYVIDCSLQEPESTFLHPTPEYTIEIEQRNPYLEEELIEFFEQVACPHRPKNYLFRGAKGIKFTSVIKPRVPKGIEPYTHTPVVVRAKPTTNGEFVSNCALTLVTVFKQPEAIEPDWYSMTANGYNFWFCSHMLTPASFA